MKFLSIALALFLSVSVSAKKVLDKQRLLRNAIPVDSNGNPRRDLQNNNYYSDYNGYNSYFNRYGYNNGGNYNNNNNNNQAGYYNNGGQSYYNYNANNANYNQQQNYNNANYNNNQQQNYNNANGNNGNYNANNGNYNNANANNGNYNNGNANNANANGNANNGNNNANMNGGYYFKIDGSYSIRFKNCVSVVTEPQDGSAMFDNYLIDDTKAGKVVSQKSYVLFNVCETSTCYYTADDTSLYMVDVADYLAAFIEYVPQQNEEYCRACEEATDYCASKGYFGNNYNNNNNNNNNNQNQQAEEEAEQEEDQEVEEGEGGRRLWSLSGETSPYVTCAKCKSLGCLDEEQDQDQNNENGYMNIGTEEAAEWIQQYVECQQTGQTSNEGYDLYAGFMCNSDGTGVELAVFLDEECSVYSARENFHTLMSKDSDNNPYYKQYLSASQEIVKYPFLNNINCKETQYYVPKEAYNYNNGNGDGGEQNNNNNNGNNNANGQNYNNYQANEACTQLFEDSSRSVDQCKSANDAAQQYGANNNNYNYNQYKNNGNNGNGDGGTPSWYKYEISQQNAEGTYMACKVVAAYNGDFSSHHVYRKDISGTSYSYGAAVFRGGSAQRDAVKYGTLLAMVIIVTGVLIFIVRRIKQQCEAKSFERDVDFDYVEQKRFSFADSRDDISPKVSISGPPHVAKKEEPIVDVEPPVVAESPAPVETAKSEENVEKLI